MVYAYDTGMTTTHIRELDRSLLERARRARPNATNGDVVNEALRMLLGDLDVDVEVAPAKSRDLHRVQAHDYGGGGTRAVIESRS